MNVKVQNKATVILLEILGILGVDTILKTLSDNKGKTQEEIGYFIINYLFRNIRMIQPQLEELIALFIVEDVSILKGIAMLKDNEEVVSFFTESLGEVMRSV